MKFIFILIYPFISFFIFIIYLIFGENFGFLNEEIKNYGKSIGTLSSILVFIQYAPQMYTTYQIKGSGSLSTTMLLIQAPGGIINCLFMAIGQKENFSTWLPFLVSALQQFILLGMCFYYDWNKNPQYSGLLTDEVLESTSYM